MGNGKNKKNSVRLVGFNVRRDDQFFRATGIDRLKRASKAEIALKVGALILSIVVFVYALIHNWPALSHLISSMIDVILPNSAYAQTADTVQGAKAVTDTTFLIHIVLTGCLVAAFFLFLVVSLFSKDADRIARADDYFRVILGFMIGALEGKFLSN